MGRYDFRPHRVHQATAQLLATERLHRKPPWYDVVGSYPPSRILVRTQPHQHEARRLPRNMRKPSKLFKPLPIRYEEDVLRKDFFSDHPWELARPRTVLEDDGRDSERGEWSSIRREGRSLDGESVVQRQLWLMQNKSIGKASAYDQARREFYEERLQEEVERRVAKEEAEATGAYFGLSTLEIGMQEEDKWYERWKTWAIRNVTEEEQRRMSAYTGSAIASEEPEESNVSDNPEEVAKA